MTLSNKEIFQAAVEFLSKRGIDVKLEQMTMSYGGNSTFIIEVKDIDLPPKEGPYR